MRKAVVRKSQVHVRWNIEVRQPAYDGWSDLEAIAWADTHAEAMFLAQLLADPHEYIRAAQERAWHRQAKPGLWTPLERVADPSQPRRFDSLADVPEDVERAAGKYLGYPCELARSPLSGTGWMIRVNHERTRQHWVEYMGLHEDDLTDIGEVIDQ